MLYAYCGTVYRHVSLVYPNTYFYPWWLTPDVWMHKERPSNTKLMPILLPSGKLIGMWIKTKRSSSFFLLLLMCMYVKSQWHTTSNMYHCRSSAAVIIVATSPCFVHCMLIFNLSSRFRYLRITDRKCDIFLYTYYYIGRRCLCDNDADDDDDDTVVSDKNVIILRLVPCTVNVPRSTLGSVLL